jgi:DNA end-binding protein Ku
VKATQSIDIIDFVDLGEIDPMYFDKPYYLEPQKTGRKAYALLRDTLTQTGKVGIAKVVIKTRQHLAALKPRGNSLVLELMHFNEEVLEPGHLDLPKDEAVGKKEMDMAKALVETMTGPWDPAKYTDDYRTGLMKLIEQKVEQGGKEITGPRTKKATPTNVVDMVEVLRRSLEEAQGSGAKKKPEKRRRAA